MSEEKDQYMVKAQPKTLMQSEEQVTKIIDSLYPGADMMTKRATVLLGLKYNLDPILKEIMIIELGNEKGEDGKWRKKYSAYIGQDGMETVADRSKIRWTIQLDRPKAEKNPYTNEDDIWLEGTLYRDGYRPFTDGRWFSEVAKRKQDGELTYKWKTSGSEMHRKSVRLYLLRRGFSIAGDQLASPDVFVDEGKDDYAEPEMTVRDAEKWLQRKATEIYQNDTRREEPAEERLLWIETNLKPLVPDDKWDDFIALTCQNAGLTDYFAKAFIDGMRDGPLTPEVIQIIVESLSIIDSEVIKTDPQKVKSDIEALYGPDEKTVKDKPKKNSLSPIDQVRKAYNDQPADLKDVPPDCDISEVVDYVRRADVMDFEAWIKFVFDKAPGGLSEAHIQAILGTGHDVIKAIEVK